MSNLCPCVDNTTDESNNNGRNAAECDWSREEDQAGDGNRELVECSNHGIGGGGCDTDTPGGAVGDEDGSQTRVDHSGHKAVPCFDREVFQDILVGPVLEDKRAEEEDRNSKEIVVEHGWREKN